MTSKIPFCTVSKFSLLICTRYHVPKHVQEHIDYITPGIKLTPVVKRSVKVERRSSYYTKGVQYTDSPPEGVSVHALPQAAIRLPPDLRGCGVNMTPPCIKALYKIPDAKHASPDNSLGLYEQGSYFNKEDLNLFYAQYAPYVPQGTFPIPALIDGANYSVSQASPLNSGEANIDIDMA